MNIETISMPKHEAVAKIAAYRNALKTTADKEYAQALQGYRALAKGTVLIDPFQAIRDAGWDDLCRPRLAIARADQRRIELSYNKEWAKDTYGSSIERATGVLFNAHDLSWRHKDRQIGVRDMKPSPWRKALPRVEAIVPMIPADVLPKRGKTSQWYILWEAEWQNVPPRDPLLLKPIGGNLYAVLASWDLTELERKIIARR
jgi:hypothetical protein